MASDRGQQISVDAGSLGLGDEPSPEGMEIHERAALAFDHVVDAETPPVLRETLGEVRRALPYGSYNSRARPFWEQVVSKLFALNTPGDEFAHRRPSSPIRLLPLEPSGAGLRVPPRLCLSAF